MLRCGAVIGGAQGSSGDSEVLQVPRLRGVVHIRRPADKSTPEFSDAIEEVARPSVGVV